MKKGFMALIAGMIANFTTAQQPLTPEKLWELNRIGAIGLSSDKNYVFFSVSKPNMEDNTFKKTFYKLSVKGGVPVPVSEKETKKVTEKINASGSKKLIHKSVKINPVFAKDFYQDLDKSTGQVYKSLNHRHWDKWTDGTFNHVFIENIEDGKQIDIMENLPYYCPQEPFGGSEDYIWNNDGTKVLYVTKAKTGTDYVLSTNTDIYQYDIQSGKTINITEGMMGYDTRPSFNKNGVLAWLSMKEEGNEADKNDLIILQNEQKRNITEHWDNTIFSYIWSNDGNKIYFLAATDGTEQVFEINPFDEKPTPKQLTKGNFDINGIIGQAGDLLVVTRTDMNQAAEIYTINLAKKSKKKAFLDITQLSHINDDMYKTIAKCEVKERIIKTTDGKDMFAWVIYPPDFNPEKKYPTLLYCQGGPQSALTQFYSFRWNFQLMASQGYIVIAPSRRGMPGFGTEWNAQISKDWGGQVIKDYLSAIDDISKESYVDTSRLGAIGASYGGYSVFYLAGIHNKRFKSFIAHCGVFNLQSMYGTTEELFFNNNEIGGAYWEKDNEAAKKSYRDFNPIELVGNWDTPILIIHGGKDYRVPKEQGLQAFTAAQVRGIKSELLYFPDENHWVLKPQNGLFWQRNFFRWLKETL
ncbi:peptidase S9 [Capnocytophaga cynodegmi]|uniref:S9 family peptidase n=1 Tax=Capnocytophaga cynodegmi TaxID=28189 RepID=UPI001EE2AFD0|nr:S9 family peptidase [Capnocytophaga cynodegmi]GJQ06308.1 peptidase S9 [Capnocytophaga cynodegmi]